MNNSEIEKNKNFPKEIATALIVAGVLISLAPLGITLNEKAVLPVVFGLVINFVFVPAIFLLFGGIQKFRDRRFNLWNAYYLGLFVAIVLAARKLMS